MVGQILGNYAILEKLAQGGSGIIYRAEDKRLKRQVALKVLAHYHHSDPESKERFLREARAAAALDHPNIGTVYGIDETPDGQLFMVMALYLGQTVEAHITQNPRGLALHQALSYAYQSAQGLHYAHQAKLIHRDIKPANLFITEQGIVKVLDFGIAKEADSQLTRDGSALGTPAYMSPEVLLGEAVDPRTDLWSWGLVLFEMLTATPAFKSKGLMVINAILHNDPEKLEDYLPPHAQLPALQAILDRVLHKDLQQRYPSMLELMRDLEKVLMQLSSSNASAPYLTTFSSAPHEELSYDTSLLSHNEQVPHNLPGSNRGFVGRSHDLQQLRDALESPEYNLITLSGQGGMGKTRLALEAAIACSYQAYFPEGIFWLPLDSIEHGQQALQALANVLAIPQASWPLIIDSLQDKRMLLLLDNLEHLMELVDPLSTLLEQCPQLTLLVTSRERLNLDQELVIELAGFSCPEHSAQDFESFPSTALFLQVARRSQHNFQLSEEDKSHVLTICQAMEGWPLGIELAAAWVKYMGCEEIAQELARGMNILESRVRNVSARHRSAQAVFHSSWQLLSPEEQRVMRQLTVFCSGFPRKAGLEVAQTDLGSFASLMDKSWLHTNTQGRYYLHPLVRQFCTEALQEYPEEKAQAALRHAQYFANFLQRLEGKLRGPHQEERNQTLRPELDNVRAAWQWLRSNSRDHPEAMTIITPFYDFLPWFVGQSS